MCGGAGEGDGMHSVDRVIGCYGAHLLQGRVCVIVMHYCAYGNDKTQSNEKARLMGNPLFYITWVAMGACEALMASGDIQY